MIQSRAKAHSRLGIIHLLGWMLGCAIVLAVLRAIGEFSEISEANLVRARLTQLGFGLAYGTALAGFGLFLWRWWSGHGAGPTQPGHWLLLFGGAALIIDLGVAGTVAGMFHALGHKVNDLRVELWHLAIGCSLGLAILTAALARMREATWL